MLSILIFCDWDKPSVEPAISQCWSHLEESKGRGRGVPIKEGHAAIESVCIQGAVFKPVLRELQAGEVALL